MADRSGAPTASERVPIGSVRVGPSPRTVLVDHDHVAALMGCVDELPPIAVHRQTRVVVDGLHRLEAWRRSGRTAIPVEFLDGDGVAMLAESIRRNIGHGKPLTVEEREAAGRRMLHADPSSSDRRIAEICGLSPTTVGRLRANVASIGPPDRVGRDGRRRPVDPARGRTAAAELLAQEPSRSNRSVAAEAGVSPATVRDVRQRASAGEPHLPPRQLGARSADDDAPQPIALVRWMGRTDIRHEHWLVWAPLVPLGSIYTVADDARRRAEEWLAFAEALERRPRST